MQSPNFGGVYGSLYLVLSVPHSDAFLAHIFNGRETRTPQHESWRMVCGKSWNLVSLQADLIRNASKNCTFNLLQLHLFLCSCVRATLGLRCFEGIVACVREASPLPPPLPQRFT
jgi:hypothetical protein